MYEDIADLPAGVVMTVARRGRQESLDLFPVSGTGPPALSCVLLQLGLGLLLREAIRLESDAAQQPPPTNSLERWALIAQQAINFTRSRGGCLWPCPTTETTPCGTRPVPDQP